MLLGATAQLPRSKRAGEIVVYMNTQLRQAYKGSQRPMVDPGPHALIFQFYYTHPLNLC